MGHLFSGQTLWKVNSKYFPSWSFSWVTNHSLSLKEIAQHFFLPGQIKLMPLERLLLVNKPIAENSETLVDPQSQEGLPRILIVFMAAQQSLEDLSESILIFVSVITSTFAWLSLIARRFLISIWFLPLKYPASWISNASLLEWEAFSGPRDCIDRSRRTLFHLLR